MPRAPARGSRCTRTSARSRRDCAHARARLPAVRRAAEPWARWTITEQFSAQSVLVLQVETTHLDEARGNRGRDLGAAPGALRRDPHLLPPPGPARHLAAAPRAMEPRGRLCRDRLRALSQGASSSCGAPAPAPPSGGRRRPEPCARASADPRRLPRSSCGADHAWRRAPRGPR